MDFSHLLKELRTESKMTAKELSSKIGYSTNLIYDWEKGRAEPNCETLIKLAGIFDVSVDYLLGLEDDFGVKKTANTPAFTREEIDLIFKFRELPEQLKTILIQQINVFSTPETLFENTEKSH